MTITRYLTALLFMAALATQAADEPPTPSELQMNFKGVAVDTVLDYLSKAGGFIIVQDAPIPGTIDIIAHEPVTPEEAVQMLHSVLNDRGYALIRQERILRLVKRDVARTRDLPVRTGSDPAAVAKSGEMVTQIVPIRNTNAAKLIETLKPLLPEQATITANDDSNALVITDTQVNIRRMMEIIKALDTAVSSILDIKVLPLKYADATETAEVINKIYETPTSKASSQNSGNSRTNWMSRMRGGGGGAQPAEAGEDIKQTANYVKAVPDERGNAVVVTAPTEVIPQIQLLVQELDIATEAATAVQVFTLRYADATEIANVIAGLYPDTTSTNRAASNQDQQQSGRRSFFARMMGQQQQPADTGRKVTGTTVLAVADTRTNAVIVSASVTTMPEIVAIIDKLDETPQNVPTVYIYQLKNGDVTNAKRILDSMFEDVSSSGSSSSSSRTTTSATRTTSGTGNTARTTGGNTGTRNATQ